MNKTVALVGKCILHRNDAPFADPNVDIWSVSELLSRKLIPRADAMFEMHLREEWDRPDAHKDPNYQTWIKQPHPFPIYMNAQYPDVPACEPYPFWAVAQCLQTMWWGEQRVKHFNTCTMPFMIALALLDGYKRIELYGFEMSVGKYIKQRDSGFFWMGVCAGRGVELVLPASSRLVDVPLYGYTPLEERE